MDWVSHEIFSVGTAYFVNLLAPNLFPMTLKSFTGVMLGTLLPDIDHEKSKVSQYSCGLGKIVQKNFGHRGAFHSIVFALGFGACAYLVRSDVDFSLGISFGYLGHLLGDYLTPSGVPFLWPNKRRFSIHKTKRP